MKKLILFIHALGGSKETWGDFEALIEGDSAMDKDIFDIAFYEYPTTFIRPKEIMKHVNKLLSFITPQTKIPRIQELSFLLKNEMDTTYKDYSDIYLIAHSMGGLVVKNYLLDELNLHKKPLRIKRVLFYATPHLGSNLAKLELLYRHEQIAQLNPDSDFLYFLNRELAISDVAQKLTLHYALGLQDDIVDVHSAQEHYKNQQQLTKLNRAHRDIVKPESLEDESYQLFRAFVLKEDFLQDVIQKLNRSKIVALFYQKYSDISSLNYQINDYIQNRFQGHLYAFEPPSDETSYFQKLSKCFGVCALDSSTFKDKLKGVLDKANGDVLLYIKELEKGDAEANRTLANIIHDIKNDYPNFFCLLQGQEQLFELVFKEEGYSPLRGAGKLYFPNNHHLDAQEIRQLLKERFDGSLSAYSKEIGAFDLLNEPIYAKLFWLNLANKQGEQLIWNDEAYAIAKELNL